MKKIIIPLISALSIILYSCASNPKIDENQNAQENQYSENTEIVQSESEQKEEISESESQTEQIESQTENQSEETESPAEQTETQYENQGDETETSEENSEEKTDIFHEELAEIVEPEVIEDEKETEEIPEIVEEKTDDETVETTPLDDKTLEDLQSELDSLPPVEIFLSDAEFQKQDDEELSDDEKSEVAETENSENGDAENIDSDEEKTDGAENPESENPENVSATENIESDESEKNPVSVEISVSENENQENSKNVQEEIETVPSADDENGIIDITDDDETIVEEEKQIIPSRSVSLNKNEILDVTYPGNGWIYSGLVNNTREIIYSGRTTNEDSVKFSLQAKKAGTVIAHFYKNDFLTGDFVDDYIEITILNKNGSNKTHITAPEYKTPLPKVKENNEQAINNPQEPQKSEETESKQYYVSNPVTEEKKEIKENQNKTEEKQTQNENQTANENETPAVDTDSILKEAENLYKNQDYEKSAEKLIEFFEYAQTKLDRALYLQGLVYEAKSSVQNINKAIDSYTKLTENYPASKYWNDANKKIIYLKRFYLEGR